MRRRSLAPALALALVSVVALTSALGLARAHGEGAAGGDTLARAPDLGGLPARVLEELEPDAPHYYRIHLPEGATLRIVAPTGAPANASVRVFVFGPELRNDTILPPDLEAPEGWGALVFVGNGTAEHVDPRLPARLRVLAEPDVGAGERVIVLRSAEPLRIGLVAEGEGYAWQDLALMPTLRGDARAWSGVPAWTTWLVGGVGALAALAPFALPTVRRAPSWPLLSILGAFAAATFGASTALLIVDAARAGHWPWHLLAVGAALAAVSVWASIPRGPATWRSRIALLACGLVGIAAWSGFLWGPVAAIAGALIPEPEKETS